MITTAPIEAKCKLTHDPRTPHAIANWLQHQPEVRSAEVIGRAVWVTLVDGWEGPAVCGEVVDE